MDGPNFDPVIGEEVRVQGQSGLYKIIGVDRAVVRFAMPGMPVITDGSNVVSLRREGRNTLDVIGGVPWTSLVYVDETRAVRRVIEWLKTNPDDLHYPENIGGYEIEARNDHAGNPSIFVRFLADTDYFYENGRTSQERIATLNKFTFEVEQILLGLGLDRWIYVRFGEVRRALEVAS